MFRIRAAECCHCRRGLVILLCNTAQNNDTMNTLSSKDRLLGMIRQGAPMTLGQQARLVGSLSVPAVLAQLTTTMMQYIDASMVGSLGAEASASIGLVETTTWLLGSLCSAAATGFYVQVSHQLGASRGDKARSIVRQGIVSVLVVSAVVGLVALSLSPVLPGWLGGTESVCGPASAYLGTIAVGLPAFQFSIFGYGMLRSSGDMVTPGVMSVAMMALNVVFNFFLIFPSRTVSLAGVEMWVPGAGLAVEGAALATVMAELTTAIVTMYLLCCRNGELNLRQDSGSFRPTRRVVAEAVGIGVPAGLQQVAMTSAYIATTAMIAPLGTVALAANSFAIIVESLCYMPGYGIADAATTLAGQSLGAGRLGLTKRFAWICVATGIAVMAATGAIMYVFAPDVLAVMTPVDDIRQQGTEVLRIEAFAEPLYAAAIVGGGVFAGLGRTIVPCAINLASIWGVRIVLIALLAPSMGLRGAWLAMCIELCFRGCVFLAGLAMLRWRGGKNDNKQATKQA